VKLPDFQERDDGQEDPVELDKKKLGEKKKIKQMCGSRLHIESCRHDLSTTRYK